MILRYQTCAALPPSLLLLYVHATTNAPQIHSYQQPRRAFSPCRLQSAHMYVSILLELMPLARHHPTYRVCTYVLSPTDRIYCRHPSVNQIPHRPHLPTPHAAYRRFSMLLCGRRSTLCCSIICRNSWRPTRKFPGRAWRGSAAC